MKSVHTFVINCQQHVSAIKAIFRLNTIIIGNIYYSAMLGVRSHLNIKWCYKMYYTLTIMFEDFVKFVN